MKGVDVLHKSRDRLGRGVNTAASTRSDGGQIVIIANIERVVIKLQHAAVAA